MKAKGAKKVMERWLVDTPIVGAMVGLFVLVSKHIKNQKRHPDIDKGEFIRSDLCEERTKRIESLIQSESKRNDERHEELKSMIKGMSD